MLPSSADALQCSALWLRSKDSENNDGRDWVSVRGPGMRTVRDTVQTHTGEMEGSGAAVAQQQLPIAAAAGAGVIVGAAAARGVVAEARLR